MNILPVFTCLILFSTAFSRDFRPDARLEMIPASDSSVQECYVFRTTAGVHYTVETSNDLTLWTAQDEIYGMGNEYVVTMRQFTPPPPPPPGSPPITFPPPAKNVSIRMERSSAAEGGTVVSWPSLDDGGPVVVRIAGEMVPEWLQIPLYFERFDNHYFFVWHPGAVAAPPAVNSILGENDSAMLAVLEASLPTMNTQVTTSVAAARNAPVPIPVPVDPDSKRFWRILVNPDIDTDLDGSPDWAEFEIAAREVEAPASLFSSFLAMASSSSGGGGSAAGDAFNSDTNGDGVPDGEQLDVDRDGTPDSKDPDSADHTTFVPIGPVPRYALFEIPTNPIQINDLGTVLYADKTWKGGIVTNLPDGPLGAPPASGRGINELDVIIGTEGRDSNNPADPQNLNGKICFWPSPSQSYQYVQVTENGKVVFAYRHHDGFGNQGPASIFSTSGHFVAHGYVIDAEPEYEDLFDWVPTIWQVPTGTASASRSAAPLFTGSLNSPSLIWGGTYPLNDQLPGTVHAPSALPPMPFIPFNVIALPAPTGSAVIFATPPVDFTNSSDGRTILVFDDGKWRENKVFASAIDIAADGTAISSKQEGLIAPVLINGVWSTLPRSAPGAPSSWLTNAGISLHDISSKGWILARDDINSKSAALLPIRVEGVAPVPVNPEATCVDAYSIGSISPGDAVKDRIWIMAPAGGRSSEFILKAPLNSSTPLKLSAPGIKFGDQDSVTLTGDNNSVVITATNPAATGQDIALKIEMGPGEALSQPIGVKIMRTRTVKVTIHRIGSILANKPTKAPDWFPAEIELENYLNKIFGTQINATFDVTLKTIRNLEWDLGTSSEYPGTDTSNLVVPGNEKLDYLGDDVMRAEISTNDALSDPNANLNIYILGGGRIAQVYEKDGILKQTASIISGVAYPTRNIIFIDGDIGWFNNTVGRDNNAELSHVIAHEVGHCLVGPGHPDEGGGKAPLRGIVPQSVVNERLMVTGPKFRRPDFGCRLVKGEWDEAEKWFVARPTTNN